MRQLICAICFLSLGLCVSARAAEEFSAPVPEPDEFHFVVLGDAQFHQPATFNRVIDQARRLRPAFVIQVGDLIEGYHNDLEVVAAEWQRFNDQVAPLEPVKYIAVPGNHDVFNAEQQVDKRLEQLFIDTWGPLYFAFDYKNASFIALNTDSTEGTNQITGKQLAWLKETLAASKQTHKFVFMHRPPLLAKNAAELHSLFKEHGVSHVFYGHHHHYHFFEKDGVAYTMTNAAANSVHDEPSVGGFHHLLQVSVRADEVDVAVIDADAIRAQDAVWPQDNYDFYELDRRLAPDSVRLQALGEHQYGLKVPLRNNSAREIQVLMTCSSADERWQITPQQIPPQLLQSNARKTVELTVSYDTRRVPESNVECAIAVPFQTKKGEWVEFSKTLVATKPKTR